MDKKQALVEYLSTLAPINDLEKSLILAEFQTMSIPAKGLLQEQGQACHHLYYLISGMVRAGVRKEDGDDATIYFQGKNNFVIDYESFLRDRPAEFFIQAIADCEVLRVDRLGLNKIYNQTIHGNTLGRIITEKAFIITNQRLISFYTQTAEERYLNLMEAVPELINSVPQNYIASFIGVKPQSLSRIKRRVLENLKSPNSQ